MRRAYLGTLMVLHPFRTFYWCTNTDCDLNRSVCNGFHFYGWRGNCVTVNDASYCWITSTYTNWLSQHCFCILIITPPYWHAHNSPVRYLRRCATINLWSPALLITFYLPKFPLWRSFPSGYLSIQYFYHCLLHILWLLLHQRYQVSWGACRRYHHQWIFYLTMFLI